VINFGDVSGLVLPETPDSVRIQRIVVIGPESTGKTTLARELAYSLDTIWVPEFSRSYAETIGRPLSVDDVAPIARGQIAAEDDSERRLKTLASKYSLGIYPLVLDTDLVSTTVYSEHYYGYCEPWILEAARARLGALYLLGENDLPWLPDGVRDQPLTRAELHERFVARLDALGAKVLAVDGRGARRLEHALAAVRGWRARIASPKR
jgi:NadR type nicotinamide-nucleotide adenylyltransferase